jgi:hypothetical protein
VCEIDGVFVTAHDPIAGSKISLPALPPETNSRPSTNRTAACPERALFIRGTPTNVEEGTGVEVGTRVGVAVGTGVGTGVGVGIGVAVGTGVGTGVGVGIGVAVGTDVGTGVGTGVGFGVAVAVADGTGVGAGTGTGVGVGVAVGVRVAVGSGSAVAVAVVSVDGVFDPGAGFTTTKIVPELRDFESPITVTVMRYESGVE